MVKNEIKPIVAHFSNVFFAKSETFIYHYISNIKQFDSICLAWKTENLDQFHFPNPDLYKLQLKQHTPAWYFHGILKYLFKRNFHFESIIKRRNAKLLHAHFGHNGVQLLNLNRKLNLPMITTFYGADLSKNLVIESLKDPYLELFKLGNMFLVEGQYMRKKIHQLGCPLEKILIQRIAIPIDRMPFRKRNPKKKDQTVELLFCGRFTEKKGLIFILKALKKIWENKLFRNFHLSVIGDGDLREQIKNYINSNQMKNYVTLKGFLQYQEFLNILQKSDIFIHPSVTAADGDSEGGAPTTILEAQAMGLPIISTFHADIPNIVVPGESALLSPERNIEELKKNILYLLENQHIWAKMGETGRHFVEKYHDIKNEVFNLEEKYQKLIN